MTNRRDFLRLLSASVGAAFVSGCGSDDASSQTALPAVPNGYRFMVVAQTGQLLGGGGRIAVGGGEHPPFSGGVVIHDSGKLFVHARDEQGRRGIYRADIDLASQLTVMDQPLQAVIRQGDALQDGSTVRHFSVGDGNAQGSYLTVVHRADKRRGLYLYREAGGLSSLLPQFTTLESVGGEISGHFGPHVSLHDGDDLLFTAHVSHRTRAPRNGPGLFFMPGAERERTELVVGRGDVLPGSSWTVASLGIAVLHDAQRYILQGTAQPPGFKTSASSNTRDKLPHSFVLRGRVRETPSLLEAHTDIGASVSRGSTTYGPRLGARGGATIAHLDAERTQLRLEGKPLLTASTRGDADRSPLGSPVISMFPPLLADQMMALQIFTQAGMELVLGDASGFRTLLARGDRLNNKTINTLMFGAMPRQATRRGHLAGVVEFTDKSHAVVVGLPV